MIDSKQTPVVSHLQVARAHFAKDWRFFRVPIAALLVVNAGYYLLGVVAGLLEDPPYWQRGTLHNVFTTLSGASLASCPVTALLASAFGGIAIAGERADRTADFLGMLPVTRSQIILSKWCVSILILGASALCNLLVAGTSALIAATFDHEVHKFFYDNYWRSSDFMSASACCIGCSAGFFGVAWLISTFINSGPISTCISIAVTGAWFLAVELNLNGHGWNLGERAFAISVPPLVIGLASLAVGAMYYLRRIAP